MLRIAAVLVLAVWLLALATSQTFNGWINVLPLIVLLGMAVRFVYALVTAD